MLHIRRVTDLRTGIVHPIRDSKGKFIARKEAANIVHFMSMSWIHYTSSLNALMIRVYARRAA